MDRRLLVKVVLIGLVLLAAGAGIAAIVVAPEQAICTDKAKQTFPRVSGNIMVWGDWRNMTTRSLADIYAYDFATGKEFTICTNPAHQDWAGISGNTVVWTDWRNGAGPDSGDAENMDIFGYDLATQKEFPICTAPGNQQYPVISGNYVAWLDNRNGNPDIYGYDLTTKKEFPICTAASGQGAPSISGDIVVWHDDRDVEKTGRDIYGYDLAAKKEFLICNDAGYQTQAIISGNNVVWEDRPGADAPRNSLRGIDLATKKRFTVIDSPGKRMSAAISSKLVVWSEWKDGELCMACNQGNCSLWGYDLGAKQKFLISDAPNNQLFAGIDGNRVVWEDGRNVAESNFNMDIYATQLLAK
jgi:beta propeller repeat protein